MIIERPAAALLVGLGVKMHQASEECVALMEIYWLDHVFFIDLKEEEPASCPIKKKHCNDPHHR